MYLIDLTTKKPWCCILWLVINTKTFLSSDRGQVRTTMFTWCCLRGVTPAQRRGLPLPLPVFEGATRRSSNNKPPFDQASSSARNISGEPQMLNPLKVKNPCHNVLIPPTTCCGSGCPNCVWVEYAEKLADHYCDGGLEAERIIEKEVTDPNLKAYILMEVRLKARHKKWGNMLFSVNFKDLKGYMITSLPNRSSF